MAPLSGISKPAISRRQVVFPEPEGPSIVKNSPSRISRSTRSTARTSPKWRLTARKRTDGVLTRQPRDPSVPAAADGATGRPSTTDHPCWPTSVEQEPRGRVSLGACSGGWERTPTPRNSCLVPIVPSRAGTPPRRGSPRVYPSSSADDGDEVRHPLMVGDALLRPVRAGGRRRPPEADLVEVAKAVGIAAGIREE